MTGPDAAELSWGGPSEMSAWEALMWRADGDPRTRSTGVVLEILDGEPDWPRLYAAHQRATSRIPRLRDRVVEPLLPVVSPTWSPDPAFDLAYHVQRFRLAGDGSMRELLDLTAQMVARPLDHNRPPWEATLVAGLDGGRAAYLLKIHHSLTDGLGLIQLLGLAHSTTAEPGNQPSPPAPVPAPPVTPTSLLTGALRAELLDAPVRWTRRASSALGALGRTLRDPAGTAGGAVKFGLSLRRVLMPPSTERSPLLRDGGSGYRLVVHDIALADLKAAGKAAGGSVNDAFLAGILGAFRRWHEHFGASVDELPMAIPISLRSADDPLGGNKFAGARFVAPVGEPDPRARIATVREFILGARAEPAIGFLELIAPVLSRLPAVALTEIAGGLTKVTDVQASNVPGLGHPVYLAGARVTGIYPIGPRPGVAAMVTMVSYDGTCCIGVNCDPAVITDIELFATCLRDGFDEVLALGRR